MEQLPEEWNKRMKQLLGLTVPGDAEGVLQDIHWAIGLLGYFPSYSLGAMAAAQLFQAAENAIPDLKFAYLLSNRSIPIFHNPDLIF